MSVNRLRIVPQKRTFVQQTIDDCMFRGRISLDRSVVDFTDMPALEFPTPEQEERKITEVIDLTLPSDFLSSSSSSFPPTAPSEKKQKQALEVSGSSSSSSSTKYLIPSTQTRSNGSVASSGSSSSSPHALQRPECGSSNQMWTETHLEIFDPSNSDNIVITAAPGGGKTTTITELIRRCIEDRHILPESIFLTTFTRSSAKDLIDKIRKSLPGTSDAADRIWCDDSHALALRVLAKYQIPLIDVSYLKGGGEAQKNLKGKGKERIQQLAHVSQVLGTFLKFLKNEQCVNRNDFLSSINMVVVDEFQDLNEEQVHILQEFHKAGKRIVAVGDPMQELFAWRGSSVYWIMNFESIFAPAKRYFLSRNHRCTQAIVDVANAIMRSSSIRYNQPEIVSAKAGEGRGPVPLVVNHSSIHEQIVDLAARISAKVDRSQLSNAPSDASSSSGKSGMPVPHGTVLAPQEIPSSNQRSVQHMLGGGGPAFVPKHLLRVPPHEIFVIARTTSVLQQVHAQLLHANLPCMIMNDPFMIQFKSKKEIEALCKGKIALLTPHAAKGLEADTVFVVGMHANCWPSALEYDIERERRCFYVAVTRAKRNLIIMNVHSKSSIFVEELPIHLIQTGVDSFPRIYPERPKPPLTLSMDIRDYGASEELLNAAENKPRDEEEEEEEDDGIDHDEDQDDEEIEEEEEEDALSASEADENEDTEPEFSSGDDEATIEKKMQAKKRRKWTVVKLSDAIRTFQGHDYDAILKHISRKIRIPSSKFVVPVPASSSSNDESNILPPHKFTAFVRANLLESAFCRHLEVLCGRMLHEIALDSDPLRTASRRSYTEVFADELLEEKARNEAKRNEKLDEERGVCEGHQCKRPPMLAKPVRAFLNNQYAEFKKLTSIYHPERSGFRFAALKTMFWTAMCREVISGRPSVVQHGIGDSQLTQAECMALYEEMKDYATELFAWSERNKSDLEDKVRIHRDEEFEHEMKFESLVDQAMKLKNMKFSARKRLLNVRCVARNLAKRGILLRSRVPILIGDATLLVISHGSRVKISKKKKNNSGETEDADEQEEEEASAFSLEQVVEALALASLVQTHPDDPERLLRLVMYNPMQRVAMKWSLVDWDETKASEYLQLLTVLYCESKEKARKDSVQSYEREKEIVRRELLAVEEENRPKDEDCSDDSEDEDYGEDEEEEQSVSSTESAETTEQESEAL